MNSDLTEDQHKQTPAPIDIVGAELVRQELVRQTADAEDQVEGGLNAGIMSDKLSEWKTDAKRRNLAFIRYDGKDLVVRALELFDALEQQAEKLEDALEHCGYDPTDCIDCGGPPHNEWCRFWKLRDIVPVLFPIVEEQA